MNKTKQRTLLHWLKQQSAPARYHLRLLMLLGVISGLLIAAQAWLLASLLQGLIIEHQPRDALTRQFLLLLATIVGKAMLAWLREQAGFRCGMLVRQVIRQQVLDRLQQLGPAWIQGKPVGSWATIILEQIEQMQDYYARYLPQMSLAGIIPLIILITLLPVNWVAALILLFTAPLIPLFMLLVGMGAADATQRNFTALSRLSGYFFDRLRGLDTLRLFNRGAAETVQMQQAADNLRQHTMEVLRLAFLSSAVLEFFASISIAIVAVYFGFSYLGLWDFGHYGVAVTLGAGFLALILAPEFFQPLRDLGTFYHAKAQAVGAAEALFTLLQQDESKPDPANTHQVSLPLDTQQPITVRASALTILSADNHPLAGPLSFQINPGESIAIVGHSGAGKSSLLSALLGFLPYQGSLTINDIELRDLDPVSWRQQLNWVGQNPHLPEQTLLDNILLGKPDASEEELHSAICRAHVDEFLPLLPEGLETVIGDNAARLSVGQAQRIAVARALLRPSRLLLLDEPTASLDANSEQYVMQALLPSIARQSTILVTHQLEEARHVDRVWVMDGGQLVQSGTYETLSQQQDAPFAQLLSHRLQEC